jgi:hypothetical protein
MRWPIVVAVAGAAAAGLWLLVSPANQPAGAPDKPADDAAALAAVRAPASTPPPIPQANVAPRPSPAPPAGPQVVGPRPDDPHEPGMAPHPTDPERERLHTENRLILQLNEAMSFRNTKAMRELLVEYRTLDPTDVDANQAGYAIIINCIDQAGEASVAAARQFFDTKRHSPLRRFVGRICFDNTN